MLKVNIPPVGGADERLVVRFAGDVDELAFDAAIVVGEIYRALRGGQVPAQAEVFRLLMIQSVMDPGSPVWEDVPGVRISRVTEKQGGCVDEQ